MALYVYKCVVCDKSVELIRNCEDRDNGVGLEEHHRVEGCAGFFERDQFPGSNWSMGDVLLSGSYRQHEEGLGPE